jgi:hypothetical protein
MTTGRKGIMSAAAALLVGLGLGPAAAQDAKDRTVEQYLCKDIMRESGTNRDVAIAFLHGFLLGKSGSTKFNIDAMRRETDAFKERCLDNPAEKAIDAMSKAKS